MNAFFKRLFSRDDNDIGQPVPIIDQPSTEVNPKRAQLAAESILENEALAADLDDEAGKILLDWGVTLAQQIATEAMEMDEVAAEEAMYQPMRALRKMLRATNNWTMSPDDVGLQKIIEQARVTHGPDYVSPGPDQQAQFMDQVNLWSDNPSEMIRQLRQFIENQTIP